MLNFVTDNAMKHHVVIATYIDLSKAFDCLQYDKLFKKMESIGCDNRTTNWFKDYLSNRKQLVDLDGKDSDYLDVNLGVPQGSILGPILFLIYMNDINKCDLNAKFPKFADDTTVLVAGETVEKAAELMNKTLINVDLWFRRNKLNLNPSKTRCMIFNSKTEETDLVKINTEIVQRVWDKGKEKDFKLVGIRVDEKLKWTNHVNYKARKIDFANYALRKASKELNLKNKKLIYSGLVHAHLIYSLPIWGFATKGRLNKLLVKQKLSMRKVCNLKYKETTKNSFYLNRILQLPELIEHTTLCYIHAGITDKAPSNVRKLWTKKPIKRLDLRLQNTQLLHPVTTKQWINNLPPVAQAKLWNRSKTDTNLKVSSYKYESKFNYINQYKTC